MSTDLARLSAVELAATIAAGDLSPVESVQSTIDRIEALDGEVNAVIHRRFEQALEEAGSPDLPDGPFRGVPMLLKDLWPASAGDPFHLGIKGMKRAGYVHPTGSHIVQRYREAGFVIVGRTNTPELGLTATTEPEAYGATHNPWNLDHGPGGSSGGASAAVAAGMVPAANASDGGGSIRIPAAMCNLVGLKPSRGRVPMGPMQDEWSQSAQHVVSHTVRDTADILDITAIPTLGDGVVAPPTGQPYAACVGADPGQLRIGLMTNSGRASIDVDPECAALAVETGRILEGLGHAVEEGFPAALADPEFAGSFGVLWGANAANNVAGLERLIGRELGEDDVEPATWIQIQRARTASALDIVGAQGAQHRFRRGVAEFWESGFDLLLTPTTAAPPPVLGWCTHTAEEPMRGSINSIPYAVFTSAFNVTGQPAISVPMGFTDAGLPIGAQLVAAYGREDLLIKVASQLESVVNWSSTRAPMHP